MIKSFMQVLIMLLIALCLPPRVWSAADPILSRDNLGNMTLKSVTDTQSPTEALPSVTRAIGADSATAAIRRNRYCTRQPAWV